MKRRGFFDIEIRFLEFRRRRQTDSRAIYHPEIRTGWQCALDVYLNSI
jgi:hypothetical protein